MQHTSCSCLISCINIKGIQPKLQALQNGHRMRDGRMDGRTDGVKSIYPTPHPNFIVYDNTMYTVLHRQYYACWCSGNFRSQGMSKHGIDPESQNILSPASEELISLQTQVMKSLRQYMKINISEKKINLPQAHVSFSCPVLSADLHMECTVRDMSASQITLEDIGSNI